MKIPKLTPRLQKIYDIVPPCKTICDIGTDHAYIPVCLTLSGKCDFAIASDIVKGPVERARATVSAYDAEDKVSVRLGGGLETVSENEAETIIIAGMGGLLIAQILGNSKNVAKSAKTLILQPMTAVSELREYLNQNGFTIEKEFIVREEEKLYTIMLVLVGEDTPYTKAELYMGKKIEKDENFDSYRKNRIYKLEKQINGLSMSENEKNVNRLNELKKLKEMIENENL
ncbi:MAG: SAM-dependent methyltransferase [Ruminococcaceae bacterium]|nr:SAM-dependent methyltransferase [Oscillospiraceae bacterium]